MSGQIKVDRLRYVFNEGTANEKLVLRDIDLTIKKGDFLVVLGHNGSGKSTFAKHLNAIYLPTGGKVYVDGLDTIDINKLWEVRRKAGMVFQNPDNQIVATIVEEDVAFGPENLGLDPKEIRHRVDEALQVVGMEGYKKHSPHQLSGGQKQRLAIAGVIAMRPDYLILDEPTAMLDPQGRKEVIDTLVKLNKEEGLTIVLITHFVEEAILADRVVVMEEGQIVLDGSPPVVFQQVELLKKLDLDVPPMTELAYYLKQEGIQIAGSVLTLNELVEKLCQLR